MLGSHSQKSGGDVTATTYGNMHTVGDGTSNIYSSAGAMDSSGNNAYANIHGQQEGDVNTYMGQNAYSKHGGKLVSTDGHISQTVDGSGSSTLGAHGSAYGIRRGNERHANNALYYDTTVDDGYNKAYLGSQSYAFLMDVNGR
eukprot:TRINITY_DN59675_c0_g1_i1.p1 TRINITY_DN59675_c0_g1~~TRINITY_DN59675_c0_g1_i1.p1  ORF type:complete len:143 (+),score=17.92 TRINITY_DN59675_c0_g1_i1:130-558(+)